MAKQQIPIYEYNAVPKYSTAEIYVADAIVDADLTTLFNAVAGIVDGNPGQSKLVTEADKDIGAGAPVADKNAQREVKWLVRYTDDVLGTSHSLEIPTADLDLLDTSGKFMDVSAGAGATFVTAFEAQAKSPAGNAVSFVSAEFVTRKFKGNS